MATFFNVRPVSFNPNASVIGNAGALGSALYKLYKDYDERDYRDKQAAQKADEFAANQAMQGAKLQLTQDIADRSFNYTANQDAIKQARQHNQDLINATQQKITNDRNAANDALNARLINAKINALNAKATPTETPQVAAPTITPSGDFDFSGITPTPNLKNGFSNFLNKAQDSGNTYNSTHGYARGALENIAGWGGFRNLNSESDTALAKMQGDITRGGRMAKWTLEKVQKEFPINPNISEGQNQTAARRLFDEWSNTMPTALKGEYIERMAEARQFKDPQTKAEAERFAKQQYVDDMSLFNRQKEQFQAFYYDGKYPQDKSGLTPTTSTAAQKPLQFHAVDFGDFKMDMAHNDDGTITVRGANGIETYTLDELQKELKLIGF